MASSDSGKIAGVSDEKYECDVEAKAETVEVAPELVPIVGSGGSASCPSSCSETTDEKSNIVAKAAALLSPSSETIQEKNQNASMIFGKLADVPINARCFATSVPAEGNSCFGKPYTGLNPFSIILGPLPVFGSSSAGNSAPFSQSEPSKDPKNNATVIFGKANLPTSHSINSGSPTPIPTNPSFSTVPNPSSSTVLSSRVPTVPSPQVSTVPNPSCSTVPSPRISTVPSPRVSTLSGPRVSTVPSPRVPTLSGPRVSTVPDNPRVSTVPNNPRISSVPNNPNVSTVPDNRNVSTVPNPSSSKTLPISQPQVVGPSKKSRRKARQRMAIQNDPIWEHGKKIDNLGKIVKCKYCELVHLNGINGHKHHLAGTKWLVNACSKVPNDVQMKFLDLLGIPPPRIEEKKGEKRTFEDIRDELGNKGTGNSSLELDLFNTSNKKQGTLDEYYKKQLREDICQQICRFLCTSGIPLNCVKNPEFCKMIEMIGLYGMGLEPPSFYEIKNTYFEKEVKRTMGLVSEFKTDWKKRGCTIMLDSSTDSGKKSICNILVNSFKGTVFLTSIDTSEIDKSDRKFFEMLDGIVEMVGEENVVQIVTINASNYKKACELLMEKRKRLYWTPCAAHCIDLMFEDFEKKLIVHKTTINEGKRITSFIYSRNEMVKWLREETKGKDLIRPTINRFATTYLTLACLNEHKSALNNFFLSEKWKRSKFAKLDEGKRVEQIVFDNQFFWPNLVTCLKGAIPLVKILRLVDSDENPTMPFVYEGINRAKMDIQKNFNGVSKSYEPIWEIIDDQCDRFFQPLHLIAYYLNPQFHYKPNFTLGPDVKKAYYDCLFKMVPNKEERIKIDLQFDLFHNAKGLFGLDLAVCTREKKSPVDWWESYGDDAPDLKRFAIRILSLVSSSSGFERNWSAFEMIHSKKRNQLHQQRMNDLMFVMYNSKLIQRQQNRLAKFQRMNLDDLDSDDEWITEKESPVFPVDNSWVISLDSISEREALNNGGNIINEANIARDLREACGSTSALGLKDDDCKEAPLMDVSLSIEDEIEKIEESMFGRKIMNRMT